MELLNNTILITGGSSGLGLEFARQLLALGNTVIITGRDKDKLELVKQKLPGLHTLQSDVSDQAAIADLYKQVTETFPALNILINNAGEMRKISLNDEGTDIADLTREIDINLLGPIRMVQQFLPHLKRQVEAAIINVTSGLAMIPFPVSPIYGTSKAGLRSYTQSLRVQLQATNVRVFELAAPAADTPLNSQFLNTEGFNPKLMMAPEKLVAKAINGIKHNCYEIYPGAASAIRVMSRVAPKFLLKQTGKVGRRFMITGKE